MKAPATALIDQPRPFAVHEMFFSTTDARGVITSGNDVFVHISGYAVEELIGRPHNIIRHPHMPRAAFRLVWDYLRAGKTVAAIVKNLAKDGRYYWVVALITPIPEGYLSVRFKPTGAFLGVVEPLYARMLAAEKEARAGGSDEASVMDAGARELMAALRAAGFADYDAFMRVMLCEELKSRDVTLARERRTILVELGTGLSGALEHEEVARALADTHRSGGEAYTHLNQLYRRLDELVALNETLDKKSAFVSSLTEQLRLASMNIALTSSRLGGEGLSLGVISRHMGDASSEVATAVRNLVSGINTLSERLRAVIFNLAAARLQLEMLITFVGEIHAGLASGTARQGQHAFVPALGHVFANTMGQAGTALRDLGGRAAGLNRMSGALEQRMLGLQMAHLGGVVESSRLMNQEGLLSIFSSIRKQIERTRDELVDLSGSLSRLGNLSADAPAVAAQIEDAASRMERSIDRLAAA